MADNNAILYPEAKKALDSARNLIRQDVANETAENRAADMHAIYSGHPENAPIVQQAQLDLMNSKPAVVPGWGDSEVYVAPSEIPHLRSEEDIRAFVSGGNYPKLYPGAPVGAFEIETQTLPKTVPAQSSGKRR